MWLAPFYQHCAYITLCWISVFHPLRKRHKSCSCTYTLSLIKPRVVTKGGRFNSYVKSLFKKTALLGFHSHYPFYAFITCKIEINEENSFLKRIGLVRYDNQHVLYVILTLTEFDSCISSNITCLECIFFICPSCLFLKDFVNIFPNFPLLRAYFFILDFTSLCSCPLNSLSFSTIKTFLDSTNLFK